MSIEDLNYARDSRTQPSAEIPRLDDIELPWKYGVCPVCEGKGKHVNPSIDAGGLSAEAFYDDPDFAEDYMSGIYDVTCNRCCGKRVVPQADWDAMTNEQRAAYEQQLQDDAAYEAERQAEIAMGC